MREIAPKAAELDKSARWPKEIVEQMAELGFLGVAVPTELGGAGLDTVSYVLAMEEISAACASCGVIMSVNNSLFCDPLLKFGTDRQKKEVLAPCAAGEKLGCFGLTEPMSGSDAQTMQTTASLEGDQWILNGSKNFITNGPEADYVIVFCITDTEPSGRRRHTAFFGSPRHRRREPRAPRREDGHQGGALVHPLLRERDHRRSLASRRAWRGVQGRHGHPRRRVASGIAAQALGIARAALDKSVAYAKERQAFGKPIAKFQAIQFMLSDMATELDAARLLTLRAATLKDQGVRHTVESSCAKLYASEAATRITHKAIQVHGGYGYTTEFGLERHYRDARITEIYEGTSEIQRLVIAGNVLKR